MATWSRIGVVLPNGRVKQISCRYDGEIRWLGRTLMKHFSEYESALAILDMGNLLSIEDKNYQGKELVIETVYPTVPATEIDLKDFPDEGNMVYYAYLFQKGSWWVKFNWSSPKERWKQVTESFIFRNWDK